MSTNATSFDKRLTSDDKWTSSEESNVVELKVKKDEIILVSDDDCQDDKLSCRKDDEITEPETKSDEPETKSDRGKTKIHPNTNSSSLSPNNKNGLSSCIGKVVSTLRNEASKRKKRDFGESFASPSHLDALRNTIKKIQKERKLKTSCHFSLASTSSSSSKRCSKDSKLKTKEKVNDAHNSHRKYSVKYKRREKNPRKVTIPKRISTLDSNSFPKTSEETKSTLNDLNLSSDPPNLMSLELRPNVDLRNLITCSSSCVTNPIVSINNNKKKNKKKSRKRKREKRSTEKGDDDICKKTKFEKEPPVIDLTTTKGAEKPPVVDLTTEIATSEAECHDNPVLFSSVQSPFQDNKRLVKTVKDKGRLVTLQETKLSDASTNDGVKKPDTISSRLLTNNELKQCAKRLFCILDTNGPNSAKESTNISTHSPNEKNLASNQPKLSSNPPNLSANPPKLSSNPPNLMSLQIKPNVDLRNLIKCSSSCATKPSNSTPILARSTSASSITTPKSSYSTSYRSLRPAPSSVPTTKRHLNQNLNSTKSSYIPPKISHSPQYQKTNFSSPILNLFSYPLNLFSYPLNLLQSPPNFMSLVPNFTFNPLNLPTYPQNLLSNQPKLTSATPNFMSPLPKLPPNPLNLSSSLPNLSSNSSTITSDTRDSLSNQPTVASVPPKSMPLGQKLPTDLLKSTFTSSATTTPTNLTPTPARSSPDVSSYSAFCKSCFSSPPVSKPSNHSNQELQISTKSSHLASKILSAYQKPPANPGTSKQLSNATVISDLPTTSSQLENVHVSENATNSHPALVKQTTTRSNSSLGPLTKPCGTDMTRLNSSLGPLTKPCGTDMTRSNSSLGSITKPCVGTDMTRSNSSLGSITKAFGTYMTRSNSFLESMIKPCGTDKTSAKSSLGSITKPPCGTDKTRAKSSLGSITKPCGTDKTRSNSSLGSIAKPCGGTDKTRSNSSLGSITKPCGGTDKTRSNSSLGSITKPPCGTDKTRANSSLGSITKPPFETNTTRSTSSLGSITKPCGTPTNPRSILCSTPIAKFKSKGKIDWMKCFDQWLAERDSRITSESNNKNDDTDVNPSQNNVKQHDDIVIKTEPEDYEDLIPNNDYYESSNNETVAASTDDSGNFAGNVTSNEPSEAHSNPFPMNTKSTVESPEHLSKSLPQGGIFSPVSSYGPADMWKAFNKVSIGAISWMEKNNVWRSGEKLSPAERKLKKTLNRVKKEMRNRRKSENFEIIWETKKFVWKKEKLTGKFHLDYKRRK